MSAMLEDLLAVLPSDGGSLRREAARAGLVARRGHEIDEDTFDRLVWQNAERIEWLAEGGLRLRAAPRTLPATIASERDLEGWFEAFLWQRGRRAFYDPLPRSTSLLVQNTARTGPRSGRWSRPDVCMASVARYVYAPGPIFDLFSFELKMPEGVNVLAVHEALAHSSYANFAYLALFLPQAAREESNLSSMIDQAQRHGVGLLRIETPTDFGSYRVLIPARRHAPSPGTLDQFIEDRFDESNRKTLQRWIRQ